MFSGVFSCSKKNALINYIQALGQHFHILWITRSVSEGGGKRISDLFKSIWENWELALQAASGFGCPQRELGTREGGLGAAEPRRHVRAGHLMDHSDAAGAPELLSPACPSARPLTPPASLPSSSESDSCCDYEPLT